MKKRYILVITFWIYIIIKTLLFEYIIVNGNSMYPTFNNKDVILCIKNTEDIKRGDIVVVDNTRVYEQEILGKSIPYSSRSSNIVKRVIGLPGDKLEYIGKELYINDVLVESNTNVNPVLLYGGYKLDFSKDETYMVIPENCYYVLGDNRDTSLDSRLFGFYMKNEILYKYLFTLI